MIYIDTNVIIGFMDEKDPNHDAASRLLSSLDGRRAVSRLTLVELASVYSRAKLSDPLALAVYSVRKVEAQVISIDLESTLIKAFKLASDLRLKTLDLLHIAACKTIGADFFATFDKDIVSKSKEIEKLGIRVVTPPTG